MKRITYSVSIFLLIVFTITNCQFSFAQETSPSLWEGHIDYVIITSQEFADSQLEPNFYDLIAQKERDGLVARLVTTEYIYANYPGKDNPEKIRNFIKDAYQNFGARYVLLGGDADKEDVGGESGNNIVPVRYLYAYKSKLSDLNFSSLISSLSPSNFISLFYSIMMELTMSIFTSGIPSDLYYACLDGTFDANGNGKDGEPEDEPDLFADIYVGRAPVDSEQEVSNFVRKTLSYIEAKDNGDNYLYTTYQVGEDLSKDVSSMETMFDIDEEGMVYILQAISEMGMPQILKPIIRITITQINKLPSSIREAMAKVFSAILSTFANEMVGADEMDAKPILDEILTGSSSNGFTTAGFPDYFDNNTLYDADYLPDGWSKQDITGIINSGAHIINHLGHGQIGYIMKLGNGEVIESMGYTGEETDVDDLENTKYCFVYSQTCLAGAFDNYFPGLLAFSPPIILAQKPESRDYDSVIEHFITSEHGAFAAVANTRIGSGGSTSGAMSSISENNSALNFAREFWDAVFGEGKLELGEAFNDSRHDNLHRLFDPEINSILDSVPIYGDMLKSVLNLTKSLTMRITFYETTLFGDPSLSFYTEEQQNDYKPTEITIPASKCSNKSQGWVAHDNGSDLYADKAGEWIEYMIDIPSDGAWQICLYAKNKNIRRGFKVPSRYEFKLKMYIDNTDKGQFQIPADASNYASGNKTISLTEGMHKIKFKWTNNLYWNGIINKWDSNLQAFIVVIKKQV